MSISILIYGESGTGKSTSIRNLDPKKTAIVNVLGKPLPFPGSEYKPVEGLTPRMIKTDNYETIRSYINKVNLSSIQTLIIDDFQYLMANDFMRRSMEKGYEKFTEIQKKAWELISYCTTLRDDLNVYFMSHAQSGENGRVQSKTIGKMLDEKICLEGMFTVVLYAIRNDSGYKFMTQNNGGVIAKSPFGMFDSEFIDNDLLSINNIINNYYSINLEETANV